MGSVSNTCPRAGKISMPGSRDFAKALVQTSTWVCLERRVEDWVSRITHVICAYDMLHFNLGQSMVPPIV